MTADAPPDPVGAGGLLTIDLAAIAANWRLLDSRAAPARTAAVVKADAYGLGLAPVAEALAVAGCATFFVALPAEGVALRSALRQARPEAEIFVLNGVDLTCAGALRRHGLVPVLNTPQQIADWRDSGGGPAALHIDTGMSRLGLSVPEVVAIVTQPLALAGISLTLVMSHLACAEESDHPLNRQQLDAFRGALGLLSPARASLANSSGIFLGADYHLQMVRPGAALYGVNPTPNRPNPMAQVVCLEGKILQLRDVDAPQSVGYGATHRVRRPARLATVAVGYADGYFRALGNRGKGHVDGRPVPLVGRVSMDLTTFDVTDIPAATLAPGATVELIGPHYSIDDLADAAGTISYEVLTSLGRRFARRYRGGPPGDATEEATGEATELSSDEPTEVTPGVAAKPPR